MRPRLNIVLQNSSFNTISACGNTLTLLESSRFNSHLPVQYVLAVLDIGPNSSH